MENNEKNLNMTNIQKHLLRVNGKDLIFFAPENDHTIFGTLSCLQNNKFSLNKVPFAEDDIVVDIGCNVGLMSLVIASQAPFVKILAFDASTTAIDCLKMAIEANGIKNLEAFNFAIGADDEKEVTFYSDGKNKSCLIESGLNGTNVTKDCVVSKIKIDDIFDCYAGGEKIKYLKMDIEGGEFCIFNRLFNERKDLLEKIEFLHLEVHEFKELDPDGLRAKVKAHFGDRVFFDT